MHTNLQISHRYILSILQHFATKLRIVTNFKMFLTNIPTVSLLRRGFNTAKLKAIEASARFLTQHGVESGGDTNYI